MTFPPDNIQPMVTVLMPVYNAARYLREALESVLSQTNPDFELLVIDDASTDASAEVVRAFHDPRIRLLRNDSNLGVARTLNRGAQLARGRYIARMDADDVCLPERLERQVEYLELHPEVEVLGTRVLLIGADGGEVGVWQEDGAAVTGDEIRAQLPLGNCLAHPTVMMRRELLLRHPYHEKVPYAQDYELWLRLAARGCRIEKLDQVLLKHRVHRASVTFMSNREEGDLKNVRIKSVCLARWCSGQLPRSAFMRSVIRELVLDLHRACVARGKRMVRETLVRAGMLCGNLAPPRRHPSLFFFFPFYHVGGGERVHADIVQLAADLDPLVVITNRSRNASLKKDFERAGKLLDLSRFLESLPLQAFLRGYLAALINKSVAALVFGCNSPFFYTLLPYLRPGVRVVDLIHAFGGGIEEVSLPYCERIDRRIVIDGNTLEDLRRQYSRCGVAAELAERIDLVRNKVAVPASPTHKSHAGPLRLLYVGRGSEEKRAHLVGRIASLCHAGSIEAQFTLVGDLEGAIAPADRQHCRFLGELHSPERIAEIYREHDLLLITSSREGFPLVIMEAMAHGVVPVATDVGGIGLELSDGENGFLVPNGSDDPQLVCRFADIVARLHHDRTLLRRLSQAAYRHAEEHFGGDRFDAYYRGLFAAAASEGGRR